VKFSVVLFINYAWHKGKNEFGYKRIIVLELLSVLFQMQVHVVYMGEKPTGDNVMEPTPYYMQCLERVLGR
jgi:hypothetical protein